MIVLAVTGDIHSPTNLQLFKNKLRELDARPDIFMLSGDVILKGSINEYSKVIDAIDREIGDVPIVAVFGNEEYGFIRTKLKERYSSRVIFLDDEFRAFSLNNRCVGVVGTQGSLYRPTRWQKRNIPDISRIYNGRINVISKLLILSKEKCDYTILLMHYAPSFKVMEGEKRSAYPWLGHPGYESVIRECRPSLVIYAHLHNSKILESSLDGVKLINSSLPAAKRIIVVRLDSE